MPFVLKDFDVEIISYIFLFQKHCLIWLLVFIVGGKVISWLQLSLLAKKIFTTRSISGVVKRQPHTYAFLQAMGDHGE
ncbi:hypothetical protein HanOQP8_Chr07g0255011 [Helianthus annuus]|nr:hypothetical protein HanOQP8_Chr07g0255011 [Helianthus annuus]